MTTCNAPGCTDASFVNGMCGWCYREGTGRCPTCGKTDGGCNAYKATET